jgi:acyl-coenzyme A thioesterase PaaI-like protein
MGTRLFRWLFNWYPPYLGAGIRVKSISPDFRDIVVQMKQHWYNRNYVGTHFGGSLYSMTDPFYMIMLVKNLGPEYIVWDKAASIEFIKPGRGKMIARFQLKEARLEEVRHNTAEGQKYTPTWPIDVVDEEHEVVAKIRKTLYIRKKQRHRK